LRDVIEVRSGKKRETDEENPLFPRIFQTFNLY